MKFKMFPGISIIIGTLIGGMVLFLIFVPMVLNPTVGMIVSSLIPLSILTYSYHKFNYQGLFYSLIGIPIFTLAIMLIAFIPDIINPGNWGDLGLVMVITTPIILFIPLIPFIIISYKRWKKEIK